MIQANALLVAISLTVTAPLALAVDVPTCEQVREQAKQYTMKQIVAMAKRAGLSKEQWAAVKECLGDKK